MATKGFSESVESRISQLKDNLNDRYYLGFPVVKELLANADDAKAKHVHLGWCPAPAGTKHPLLDRPGVFVVNDGPFRKVDENGIRQLGLGSRGADRTAIGRFGLGLKSVFHLCEALFYLASGRDGDEHSPVFDVLNPWSDETQKIHAEWDTLHEQDAKLLRNLLSPCCKSQHWFALWLPLRCERDEKPFIMQEFRGDQSVAPDELLGTAVVPRIASLLPLLSHVHSVQLWKGEPGSGDALTNWAQCKIQAGAVRCRQSKELQEHDGNSEISGAIRVIVSGTEEQTCKFCAVEKMLDEPGCVSIRSHPKWPHRPAINPVTHDFEELPEKALPHVAVHFVRSPSTESAGEIRLGWASYLPVGEPQDGDRRSIDIATDFEIILHGDFFVDAGRRVIDFEQPESIENERAVRLQWNTTLRDHGVLPLLIPGLARATGSGVILHDEVSEVTRALVRTSSLKDKAVIAHVCRDYQWLALIKSEGMIWSAIDTGQEVLELPIVESLARTMEASPGITDVSERFLLTPEDSPRLTNREPRRQWPAAAIEVLLRTTADLASISWDQLVARVDVLCRAAEKAFPEEVHAMALTFVRGLLDSRKFSELQESPVLVSRMCERLRLEQVHPLPLPCRSNAAGVILAAVNCAGAEHRRLFVPVELLGDHHQLNPTLGLEVASDALRQLNACERKVKSQPSFTRVVAHLISTCEDRDSLVARCETLPLFRDERGDIDRVWSATELRSLQAEQRVASRREDAERQWQQAVTAAVTAELAFVHVDVYRALFHDAAPNCNAQWATTLLCTGPELAKPSKRGPLLSMMVQSCDLSVAAQRDAVRYLLHGSNLPESDTAVLLEPRSDGESDVWDRITEMAMEGLGERWRLLDRDLVAELPSVARRKLDIDSVDSSGVGRLLTQIDPEAIDWSAFSSQERSQLLVELKDESLLRKLPIHETSDGRLAAIGPATFLRSTWSDRTPDIAQLVTQLREPADGRARARLSQLVSPFDADAVVRFGLNAPNPDRYWKSLMTAAADMLNSKHCPKDLEDRLKTTAWLPTVEGKFITPEQILRLPHDAGEVALSILVGACPLRALSSLHADVSAHDGFRECRDALLPSVREQLVAVASHLAESESARIGPVELEDEGAFDSWLSAFDGAAGSSVMPAVELLAQFKSQEHRRLCLDVLAPQLSKSLSDQRLVAVLGHLAESLVHKRSRTVSDEWRIYLAYLGQILETQDPMRNLRRLKLRSQDGTWRDPTTLSIDAYGIAANHLLDTECAHVLRDILNRGSHVRSSGGVERAEGGKATAEISKAVANSMSTLEKYFHPFTQVANEELVGALLGLLGDAPSLKVFRSRFIDKTKLEVFRDSLDWQTHEPSAAVGAVETLDDMMRKQRFTVEVSVEDAVTVVSLVGDEFEAPTSASAKTLLLGDRSPRFVGSFKEEGVGVRVYGLRLRKITPDSYGRKRCNDIMRETARSLLSDVYRKHIGNFDEKWDHLANSDQVDLEFTRVWLLRWAPNYLEQLGLRTDHVLGPVLRELKDAERQKHLEEHESVPLVRRKGEARESELRQRLADLLQNDESVADEVRARVREKISKKDEYTPESVPFELFQNADDAVTELAECHEPHRELKPEERHWAVLDTTEGLAFVHRGRCINQHQLGTANHSDWGYGQDLEKMLVLQSSDKQHGSGAVPVTGKFGLGFKSTFLVSDEPRIWSGRLRCRIHGAFLPLADREECRAIERFFDARDGLWRPTAVLLPVTEGAETNSMLERFVSLCSVQLVFARALRSCEVVTDDHNLHVSWKGANLELSSRLELGMLHATPGLLPSGLQALLCRVSEDVHNREGVLVLLGRRGFVPVPDGVPTVWVTTPTREHLNLGVVVNAQFSVHTGRARLAEHPERNQQTAERLGSGAGRSFSQFIEMCLSDWPATRTALGVDEDVDLAELWQTLWTVLEHLSSGLTRAGPHGTGRVASYALWSGESGALSSAVSRYPLVPSELPTPFSKFVRGSDVRVVVDDWLASNANALHAIAALPSLKSVLQSDSAVSKRVWKTLSTALANDAEPQSVSLESALQCEVDEDPRFDVERATRMAFVRDEPVQDYLHQHLRDDLGASLKRVEFLAMSGSYEQAERLLIATRGDDECMRAAFAPPDRVLAKGYDEECVPFVLLCRRQLRASADTLAQWGAQASTSDQRQGVVQYLVKGDLCAQMRDELKQAHRDCWVFSLEQSSPELENLPENEAIALLAQLEIISGWDSIGGMPSQEPDTEPTRIIDAGAVLTDMAEWWASEHQHLLEDFHRRTYPNQFDLGHLADRDPSNSACRRTWLVVLLLGAFHTMGRTTPEQHRSFLDYCARGGWLDRFATESDDSHMWVGFLENFFSSQVQDSQYLHWMLQLPRIYVLSRWLPEYVEAFRSLDRPGTPIEPHDILATRASSRFQGGGVDAPPLGQVLGMGYCFVVRELRRRGVIGRPELVQDCFVPVRRVRALLSGLGANVDVEVGSLWQSRAIHRFLVEHLGDEGAEFGGAFDIPLQIFASDKSLQSRLIGRTFADTGGADDSEW